MAAMHLGDFGAEVIRIADADNDAEARGYLAWNRNKQIWPLDLRAPADLGAAKALIAEADVVIFDRPPGALEPLGLDAATLTSAHPRLIHAWAPPYGDRGRWSNLAPSHNALTGLSGISFRQASYGGSPVHLIAPQAYYGQANCLAAAIGAALFERARSGCGQGLVVSGLHGAAQVGPVAKVRGLEPPIWRTPLGGAPNYRLYRCADAEWLFLGALFETFYLTALDVTGVLGEVLADPLIDGDLGAAIVDPGAHVTAAKLEAAFRTRPRSEWLEILQAGGVPCAPVQTREAWFAGPTIAANAMRVELDHPEFGSVAMPGVSLKMSGAPAAALRLACPAPAGGFGPRAAGPAPSSPAPDAPPLAGIRVLDLGAVIAGAFAGSILASFGAEVVKVESPGGDPFRTNVLQFCAYNRGKRGVILDLKQVEARDLFLDLAAEADVVIDNARLGVRERLGITYEALRAVNPRIISMSITGYGREGPQAALPGFDPLMQAQSGMMQAQGGYGDEPVFHQIAVNDVGSAAMAAFGIVAALVARAQTGDGQEIVTSLASQSVVLQMGEITGAVGQSAGPMGARDCLGLSAFERYYPCADGWISLFCGAPNARAAVCSAMGIAADGDPTRDGALADRIAAALALMPRAAALDQLSSAGAHVAPVIGADDAFTDPYLEENGIFETYSHPELGEVRGVSGFARFARTPTRYLRAAPSLGEHTEEVLRAFGVSDARIEHLIANGGARQA